MDNVQEKLLNDDAGLPQVNVKPTLQAAQEEYLRRESAALEYCAEGEPAASFVCYNPYEAPRGAHRTYLRMKITDCISCRI